MKKDMYEISVSTEGDVVVIDGREPAEEDYHRVTFPPEQIDTLIIWLQEARDELLGNKRDPE